MDNSSLKRAHVFVSGRVQGVFFRAFTKRRAQQLGITGWVSNLPDGRVEMVFEGDEEDIRKMIEWIKKGPPAAKVEGVEIYFEEYEGELEDFQTE